MWKRLSIVFLQLLVTAAGICYVFHDPEKRGQIAEALRHSEWRWLLVGWLVYGLVETLATLRWQLLLRVQGITLGWLRAGGIVIVGLFFNMFLPGLVGGDAMRLYFVFKETPRKRTRATLSVAMDRLVGLISILLLALVVVVCRFDWLNRFPETAHITFLALALLCGSSLFAIALFVSSGLGFLKYLPQQFPWRRAILRAGSAVRLYSSRPGLCLVALILTILSHLAYYLSYYCAAYSLHAVSSGAPTMIDFISLMPLVNTITAVPISFGGVGVRETLFQKLLGDLTGMPVAAAALAASLGFLTQASWGVLGGLAYLLLPLRKRRSHG
jgi:hypothetical protein